MAHVQYQTTVDWDTTLIDLGYVDASTAPTAMQGLVESAVKITTGAPTATVGKFIPGALIQNAVSGVLYSNTGSTASPVWSVIDAGSGFTLPASITDATTTTTTSLALIQNTVTTGTGLSQTMNGLTTGKGRSITHTTAVIANGGSLDHVSSTSVDTSTTTGVLRNSISTASAVGTQDLLTATALTSGIARKTVAAAATLTTGRYESYDDGALEVFGVGANGHLHTAQTTAPTIAVTNQAGITAAAITAGASDTCGIITTTGTSTGATVLDVTFNKTYTTAPKFVDIAPANAAAAMPNTGYFVSAISATGFTITVAAGGTYAATPSFRYVVIA